MQTDAILLANNSQHCWMLQETSVCTTCCMLLHVGCVLLGVVAKRLELVKLLSQPPNFVGRAVQTDTTYVALRFDDHGTKEMLGSQHFFCSVIVKTYATYVVSVCTALPTANVGATHAHYA